jgi:hypothetical protein
MTKSARSAPRSVAAIGAALVAVIVLTILVRLSVQFEHIAFGDEGILLTDPDLILRGYVPYKDFSATYTPGGFYVLAGAYRVFGDNVAVERLTSILYWCVVTGAVFLIGLRVSYTTAALSAVTALGYSSLYTSPGAHAHFAAYGATLTAILLASKSVTDGLDSRSLYSASAGLLVGVAAWFKQDLGAVALIACVVGIGCNDLQRIRAFAIGFAVPSGAMLVFACVVGFDHFFDSLVLDVLRMGAGRFLPIRLNISLVVIVICLVANAAGYFISRGRTIPAHFAALRRSIAALCLGLALLATHRLDDWVISYLGVPIVSLTLISLQISLTQHLSRSVWAGAAFATCVLASFIPVVTGHLMGVVGTRVPVTRVMGEGRAIPWAVLHSDGGPQRIVDKIRALSRPGERLFVGPSDLRFTNNNDSVFYFLLPSLRPATRYMEMNPGCANRRGSSLANDVASADWLILSSQFIESIEPNESAIPGSPLPNEVVDSQFCIVDAHGYWQLLRRCQRSTAH